MKVLLLSPYGNQIAKAIKAAGDEITICEGPLLPTLWPNPEFIVMFGWRSIIHPAVLIGHENKIINIHGGYLPYNRGAYPNLFSWVDDTLKGCTIHHVDEGIDTGRIIVRQEVHFRSRPSPNLTLKSSYDIIRVECEDLFARTWGQIRKGGVWGFEQFGPSTYHTKAEGEAILAKLPKGWDTPVDEVKQCLS